MLGAPRCTTTGGKWKFYRDARGASVAKLEMFALLDGGTELEKRARTAELIDLLKRAERGELSWDDELRDVERHKDLLELRWHMHPFADDNPPVEVRLYFAEPLSFPDLLLALHFHFKRTDDTEKAIRVAQNKAMDIAEARFLKWRLRNTSPTTYT